MRAGFRVNDAAALKRGAGRAMLLFVRHSPPAYRLEFFMPHFVRYVLLAAALCWSGAAHAKTKITFVTDWQAQAEHGGYYQALANGYYAKQGLDVTIRMGGASVNGPQLIAAGAADFVVGSNSFQVIDLLAAGADVQAVAAIFQKDPQVLITHPRTDIKSIADMKGKPIMVSDATAAGWWKWAEVRFGFDRTQIRKYTFNLAPFLTNPQAIQQGYVSSEPFLIAKEGKFRPQVYMLADYGYPGYSNLILARGKDIRDRPEIVRAFVAASVQGWRSYLTEDPSPANALIKRDNPDMPDDLIANGLKEMFTRDIVLGGDAATHGVGAMNPTRWQAFFQTMAGQGLYKKDLPYWRAYNLNFLPRTL
jgi:NitT/TauT family transport system substrate-binding protein